MEKYSSYEDNFAYSQCYHASHDANSETFPKVITSKINFLHRWRTDATLYLFYLHTSIEKKKALPLLQLVSPINLVQFWISICLAIKSLLS